MAGWWSRLWIWVLVAAVTGSSASAKPKVKLIGDDLDPEPLGQALALRSDQNRIWTGCPEPGDPAEPFTVRTLDGEFSYEPGAQRGPLVVHAFSNRSGFLECVWSSEASVSSLVEQLPPSTHLLLLGLDDSAARDVAWMRERVLQVAPDRWGRGGRGLGPLISKLGSPQNLEVL